MKDGILSVDVEPFKRHLSFLGPVRIPTKETLDNDMIDHSQLLKGHIRLTLAKTIKVKSITVKFKGESGVNQFTKAPNNQFHTYQQQQQYHPQQDLLTPILPKLKAKILSKAMSLDAGVHLIPWELEIPDIYPRSFTSKEGFIRYRVELKMTIGYNKVIVISQTIIIHRHLLPSRETALRISSRRYEHVVQKKFLFELELPKIVCLDQGYIPISLMFKSIDKVPVKFINTQLIQVEIYKCRHLSKSEIEMVTMSSKKNSTVVQMRSNRSNRHLEVDLSRFFKRIRPVIVNTIDLNDSFDSVPLILKHQLDKSPLCTIESPLITIAHQLEITFNFGQHQEEVRVKMPISISTVSYSGIPDDTSYRHVFERGPHKRPLAVEIADLFMSRSDSLHPQQNEPKGEAVPTSSVSSKSERGLRRFKSAQGLLRKRSGSLSSKASESKDQQYPSSPLGLYAVNQVPPLREQHMRSEMSNKLLDETYNAGRQLTSVATFPAITAPHPIPSAHNTFPGLPPPPRRTRTKKETLNHTQPQPDASFPTPVPTRSASASNIFSPHLPVESPLLSPFLSKQSVASPQVSKSTTIPAPLAKKRASTLDTHVLPNEPLYSIPNDTSEHIAFSYMIASHYLDSSLPAMTKRGSSLPIHPSNKVSNRVTKIYYEEYSDDDEDDEVETVVNESTENEKESHVITC
ncbi:hypothetical protein BD560DRAFT_414692 [Blakeslea trispora]|nr:hypothetical protein BD560DRAFT_414692 [Blakeslea trispora]